MSERDDFENHMRRLNPCVRLARQKTDGTYRTVSVQRAWDLWQAAALPDAVIMRLRTAGNMLSNCAFNLAQQEGKAIDAEAVRTLRYCREEWDAARQDLSDALNAKDLADCALQENRDG